MVNRASLSVSVNGVQRLFQRSTEIAPIKEIEPGFQITWQLASIPGDPQYHSPALFVTVHFSEDK